MTGIQPEPTWHTAHSAQQWTEILHLALQAHRQNPQDEEALDAIKQANEALNAYDNPVREAGEHTLETTPTSHLPGNSGLASDLLTGGGWGNPLEAIKGTAEGIGGALASLYTIPRDLATKGVAPTIDSLVEGVASIPGEIASGDARRIGRVGGNIAGGVGVGAGAKAAGGAIADLVRRPGLKNALLTEQTKGTQLANQSLQDVIQNRRGMAPMQSDALAKRIQLLENQLGRAATQDEILQAKAELAQGQVDQIGPKATAQELRNRGSAQRIVQNDAIGPLRTQALEDLIESRRSGQGRAEEMHPESMENIGLRNEQLRRKLAGDEETPIAPSDATRIEMPSRAETARQTVAENRNQPSRGAASKALEEILKKMLQE